MIPKIIHYCWFGGAKLPEIANRCIESWRRFLPGYEIKEWNEGNFDVASMPYLMEAYKAKKYAFVSDVARFKILYDYGGLYFDTDVEVIKSLDDIIKAGAFMGMERGYDNGLIISSGLGMAASSRHPLFKSIIDKYESMHFIQKDGSFNKTTTCHVVTSELFIHGLQPMAGIIELEGIRIYPPEYFNPFNPKSRKLSITDNTRTVHHYTATWYTSWEKLVFWSQCHFGVKVSQILSLLGHNPFYMVKRAIRYLRSGK